MAYIRTDRNCVPVSPQPGRKVNTDTFGNQYEDFHIDYDARNVKNQSVVFTDKNPGDIVWTRYLVDNTAGTKSQYKQGALYPAIGYDVVGADDEYTTGSGIYEPVYLALEGDDDVWIEREEATDLIVIAFTDEVKSYPESRVNAYLLQDESGTNDVTDEFNNLLDLGSL